MRMQAEKLRWSLVENDDRIALLFCGEFVRHHLLPLWEQYQQDKKRKQLFAIPISKELNLRRFVFDLSQVSRIDSAGFALLCELIQYYQQVGVQNLKLENVPSELSTLADLFGLEKWINAFL